MVYLLISYESVSIIFFIRYKHIYVYYFGVVSHLWKFLTLTLFFFVGDVMLHHAEASQQACATPSHGRVQSTHSKGSRYRTSDSLRHLAKRSATFSVTSASSILLLRVPTFDVIVV